MKRYYEGHEGVYERLAAEGADCWGEDDFDNVYMLEFLELGLGQTRLDDLEHVRVLVIGCGTGPLACALSRRGYQVSGFDISPTAIEMAKAQAQKRGLQIRYWVGDLCRDDLGDEHYDLIVDSHCLHCIVPEEDRSTALTSIRRALSPDGVFILETMMGSVDSEEAQSDEEGIIWTPYGEMPPDFEPRVQRSDGLWYVPQRRLRPDKAALDDELRAAGFQIHWSQEVPWSDTNGAGDYQGICGR